MSQTGGSLKLKGGGALGPAYVLSRPPLRHVARTGTDSAYRLLLSPSHSSSAKKKKKKIKSSLQEDLRHEELHGKGRESGSEREDKEAKDGEEDDAAGRVRKSESPAAGSSSRVADDGKTEAQRRFEAVQRERLLIRAAKAATKTHKDRVAELNEQLENLSEHYDIPKVGPG